MTERTTPHADEAAVRPPSSDGQTFEHATAANKALGHAPHRGRTPNRAAPQQDRPLASSEEQILLFNAPMPARAAVAYRQAKGSGLFDTFVVCSPRVEDFCAVSRQEAPSLGLLDPILLGLIGDQAFLIAQWDLARDLQAFS